MNDMVAHSPGGDATARVEAFEVLASRVRESALNATMRRWGTKFYFETPLHVMARVQHIHLDMLVAETELESNARAITLFRSAAPAYVSSVEHAISVANMVAGGRVAAQTVDRAMSGAWRDGFSRWHWAGWDPATGECRNKPPGPQWRDDWNSPPESGSVSRGSREIDIPKSTLVTSSPGPWTLAHRYPYFVGDFRSLVDRDGQFVALFRRAEDAVFTAIAREAVSVFGAAYEALCELIDAHIGGTIEAGDIINTIASSTPWPIAGPADTHPQEGR